MDYWKASAKELVTALKAEQDDTTYKHLGYLIGNRQLKSAVPRLIELLDHESAKVRDEAADALFKIGLAQLRPEVKEKTGQALVKRLGIETEKFVRGMLVLALGGVGYSAAIPLVKAILSDPACRIPGEAALTLGRLKAENSVHLIVPYITNEDSYIRSSAVRALGFLGDSAAVDALESALPAELGRWTRMHIEEALCILKK